MDFKLIVGLGNPGEEYENTYHNAGFLFIDHLAHAAAEAKPAKRETAFSFVKTPEKILLKPLTFMNGSGGAVKAALKYFDCSPAQMLVVHDDSDIALGDFKYSFARGAAGHKGVESIMDSLPDTAFWRLRIGVRPAAAEGARKKAGEFVLTPIGRAGQEMLQEVFSNAEKTMEKLITNDAPSGPETI